MTIATAPVEIGQRVCCQKGGWTFYGVVEATEDFRYERHYGIRVEDSHRDDLEWVTPGHLRLQPWALTRPPRSVRLHSHRLVDRDGAFICASDLRDCQRLAVSYADQGARVEENQSPIWYNDERNLDYYTGPETIGFLNGHP